uniref:glutathione transferase n=1 Tax=Hemiselmis andersenii TaxID=464988 RepID=A0A6T8PN48_HEMAN|mmetsp:Transcript_46663/g.113487  ORF Transcript_46663/g.113487 Transcript_46663/m.113487 type:complete len:268 (+) Transcript_46663:108-911(+)|eukprot:CAMPEP_0114147756 /NCGR_PEP_ID=MMETSP0043_2-20121206/21273_1 /TAXON_ID=464988 /ORGANISM="Hemiselmis andersenii, Strain CCMP644" /LENGTH=267 /DNA_ID=CAMNT_0001242309 /DNA_START=411 /DNA_END=1214 /DNA_ORIENTATION=+
MAEKRVIFGYWRTRALGQPIRVMLAYMGVPFEDRQYQVGDPPTFDKSVWNEAKIALEREGLAFPNLPYLIDTDGTAVSQTRAILRYLARSRPEHSLLGKTDEEQTRADVMVEAVMDLWREFFTMTYCSWIELDAKKHVFYEKTLPVHMARLEKQLQKFEWAAGPNLTYADFFVHEALYQMREFKAESLAPFPAASAFISRFAALPGVAAYAESEAYVPYPFHNRYSNFAEWQDGRPLPAATLGEGGAEGRPQLTGEKSYMRAVLYPA